jgi:putative tryptophan/tyrosine transport system substrate-binding protein
VRRRQFITLAGGTVATWPLAARAQQPPVPVIGLLDQRSPDELTDRLRGFRQGLRDAGFVEGQNVAIEYRWAENKMERLPELAAEFVRQQVAVIAATSGTSPALAAKAATPTIPIVFQLGPDPVQLGLVASLSRPGGNVTGVTQLVQEVAPKLLELLHELLPTARVMALLVNPADPVLAELNTSKVQVAAHALGLELHILNARRD